MPTHLPVPKERSLEELNAYFEDACRKYCSHRVVGHTGTVGEILAEEQKALFALPERRYDPSHRAVLRVSPYSLVAFETNHYSVPVSYSGKEVTLKVLPETIEIWSNREMIAKHTRCYQREKNVYDLEHYLPLLEEKGRAIFQAAPLIQNSPEGFVEWLQKRKEADNLNPKELVELIRKALEIGYDAVMRGDVAPISESDNTIEIHDTVNVNSPDLNAYDALLGKGVIT